MEEIVEECLNLPEKLTQAYLTNKKRHLEDDLSRLQERLRMAHHNLEYAVENMIVPYNTANILFGNLRSISNDLKDITDESFKHIDIMATLSFEVQYWCSSFTYIYRSLSFPWKIRSQIRSLGAIKSRVEVILKHELNFGGTLLDNDSNAEHDTVLVGGIEKDAQNIVDMLVTPRDRGMYFYGIVGERGTGKTTLARKIFNDRRIRYKFHSVPPIWVDVHKNSTFETVLESIIDKIHTAYNQLIEPMGEKEILVVLDDVNDSNHLEDIIIYSSSFYFGGITNFLVTTRCESLKKIELTHEIHRHKLSLLSEEDSWALMGKLLFKDDEKEHMQRFERIGKNIVKKCDGLPLSIKTIARILNAKERTPSEWEKVIENIIILLEPTKTLPVELVYLLPYENLSPYIKHCFIFCVFFPEDYIFEKNILIQQWIVAGLVRQPSISIEENTKENNMTEDEANDYYMELFESNILQPVEESPYYDDDEAMCRMHGNFRSFGQNLVQNYSGYFQGDVVALEEASSSSSSTSISKLHHLVITNHAPLDQFPNIVKKQTSARTLIFTSKLEMTKLPKNLFQKLKLLRILDISGSDCRVLSKSLFKLVHLCHLNLSCLPIKSLPMAIGNLINLQHLILRYCGNLLNLPDSITTLKKLRSIDLHQTPLLGMPIGIRKLSQLTSLIGFVAGEDLTRYSSVNEIHFLKELRTIDIVNLEAVDYDVMTFETNRYLYDLTLSCRWDGQSYEERGKEKMQKCFDLLIPPNRYIQQIKINGYFGQKFPTWLENGPFQLRGTYALLKRLDLLKCKYCEKLPSTLGMLPALQHLRVEDAWSIKHIGLGFVKGNNFPKLRSLILQDMPEWVEWRWEPHQSDTVMPILQSLEIINCPKLKCLPLGLANHAKSLATLTIYKAHNLEKVEGLKSVKKAMLFSNHNLSRVSSFPATCKFEIVDCPKLDVTLYSETSLQMCVEDSMQYS